MTHKFPLLALAASVVVLASAVGYAAQGDLSPLVLRAAAGMGSGSLSSVADQRDVIEPPSSIERSNTCLMAATSRSARSP